MGDFHKSCTDTIYDLLNLDQILNCIVLYPIDKGKTQLKLVQQKSDMGWQNFKSSPSLDQVA